MPIPNFDAEGNLPVGVYQSTIEEVIAHFGTATPVEQFIAGWQTRRDGGRRGIVEVIP